MNYYTGETLVQFQPHKRRQEIAQLLAALVENHPTGTISVAWENANTHEDDEVEAVLQAAAGRLVLLYLPTSSPWKSPIEMLWRHFRREVTHGELFQSMQALLTCKTSLKPDGRPQEARTHSAISRWKHIDADTPIKVIRSEATLDSNDLRLR